MGEVLGNILNVGFSELSVTRAFQKGMVPSDLWI